MTSDSESDEEDLCPICIEPVDEKGETKSFFPCPCKYRVCMFCVRRIQTEFDGRCPGCRRDYNEVDFRFVDIPIGRKRSKKDDIIIEMQSRKDLANVRVVQRNLVYLVGLAPSISKEDTLRSKEFFGQYGKIIKVAINRNEIGAKTDAPSYSAYITFSNDEDAKTAIRAVNGFWVDNYVIKASFGTTKYCNMFLRGLQCTNPDCLYLHKLGDDASSFTKEEMQAGRANFENEIAKAPPVVQQPTKTIHAWKSSDANSKPVWGSTSNNASLLEQLGGIHLEEYVRLHPNTVKPIDPAPGPLKNIKI